MIHREKEGIEWLEFEQLAEFPNLVHGVFLRPFNLGQFSGDEEAGKNLSRLKSLFSLSEITYAKQCHGDRVVEAGAVLSFPECDGLYTEGRGVGLLVQHADCQAALFYDPVLKCVAGVHSGWKGSVQNIYAKMVERMKSRYGSSPADLLVSISPSLGPNCAEFVNYRMELPESFWKFQVKPDHFDFWAISREQLEGAGVLSNHIEIASICTYEDKERFFSYRRDKDALRNGTLIALK